MRTTIVPFIMIMVAAPAAAQDRGVSIPDAHTLYADDAFVAREVTAALRTAGGMTPGWRLSTVDVPFAELLRACETDVAATLSCMAEQVVTRDPSMRDGLILFALLERNGGGMAVLHLNLRLYGMRTGELAGSLQVDVQRITAPAVRNREAAEWLRRLVVPPSVEVAETRPTDPVIVLDLQSVEGDDNAAQTVSHTLRANAAGRAGWIESDRVVTLAQMLLAHGCDEPDRACMSQIGVSLQPDRRGILIFGRMRRRDAGRDEIRIDVVLFNIALGRATHRTAFDERLSELIVGGTLDLRAREWLDRLTSADTVFEDTSQPYFRTVADPSVSPSGDHVALEIAGWSLVGLAVASAVAAIASGGMLLGANGDEGYNAYRSSWDASLVPDVCRVASSDMTSEGRHAASVCDDANLFEVLVPVFWTVAAAAGVAGALLVWHPWSLQPTLGPTGLGLDLRVTF